MQSYIPGVFLERLHKFWYICVCWGNIDPLKYQNFKNSSLETRYCSLSNNKIWNAWTNDIL